MEMIERIASFLADIVAIISGVIVINQNIIKAKWVKVLVSIIVVAADITTFAAILYFVKNQVYLTNGIAQSISTNAVGNNYGIINNYSIVACGGNSGDDNLSIGGTPHDASVWGNSDGGREIYSL